MKKFLFALFCVNVFLLYSCSDSESATEVPSETSSSSNVSESSSAIVDSDSIFRDTVSIFVEDTTGKVLHYVGNSSLRITEIAVNNLDFLDHDGDDPGYVEIYNAGKDTADLRGYSLVENLEKPRKWIIDKLIIPPGELQVIFCSDKNITTPLLGLNTSEKHFRTHTNWKLEKEGGKVYLIDYNWGIRDSVQYPALGSGISYGIVDGGEFMYFDIPTPEKKNTKSVSYSGFSEKPILPPAGFYTDSITINPTEKENASLHCTFDGSVPTKESELIEEPVVIKKTTAVRCKLYEDGKISNETTTETYFIGEETTASMPIVAISVDPEFFEKHYIKVSCSSPSSCPYGLYEDVEYPVHVEYFENGSASEAKAFEIEAGISLMGGYSRMENKKSVSVTMRENYQDGRLHYPLFKTRPENKKFKAFNLRNNGNRFVSDYIEDAMGGAISEGSGLDYQRSRQVVVFYNGKYYGIHDLRERFNRHYVETNYGIDADEVEVIKHLGREITASGDGSTAGYEELLNFVASNDFSGANNEAYEKLRSMMNVGNFADYMALEIYSHNGDWPNNNVRAYRTATEPWKFMIYDLDHGYDWEWVVNGFSQSTNMFKWIKQGGVSSGGCYQTPSEKCFHTLYVKLIENPDFKRLFINRSAVMLENYLNGAKVEEVVNAMVSTIDPEEIERDMKKYDRTNRGY